MTAAISLFLTAIILASCVNPEEDQMGRSPFVDAAVLEVVTYNNDGTEKEIFFPKGNKITVFPTEEKIAFYDDDGEHIEFQGSYQLIRDP